MPFEVVHADDGFIQCEGERVRIRSADQQRACQTSRALRGAARWRAAGLSEAVTWSFMPEAVAAATGVD